METDEHTTRRTLAGCAMCQVEHCAECDVVHVHVGHASLRLTMSGFLSMCATLLEAARRASERVEVQRRPLSAPTGLQ